MEQAEDQVKRTAGLTGASGPEADLEPRVGGIALKNGLILLTERHWAAAIREGDGSIGVASGKKSQLPGTGSWAGGEKSASRGGGAPTGARSGARKGAARRNAAAAAADAGVPLLRGLGRFGETLLVLAQVKSHLPNAQLPLESGRVAAALAAAMAATSAVKAMAPRSGLVEEVGTALASFIPAVLALKGSAISGYHGAEHKVIGGREAALRAAARAKSEAGAKADVEAASGAAGPSRARTGAAMPGAPGIVTGDSAAAAKEHDRCGSNLVGPYLLATIATNWLARGPSGKKTPVAAAAAGAASLGIALEALRWASQHGDSLLARLMLSPGRMIQKRLTTSEPTPDQLEVGERALEELMRLENAGA